MSSIKTVAVIGVFVGALATGVRSQREPALEEDGSVRPVIEAAVQASAADFNPQVNLTQRELHDFRIVNLMITRPRILALINSAPNAKGNYDVYVRFREGGDEGCLTLELAGSPEGRDWKARRAGSDRCSPLW